MSGGTAMYGQFEIWRMAHEAEQQVLKERQQHLQHLHRWRSQQPSTLRSWLNRRPHIRTVTIRLPLPVFEPPIPRGD
jgi:hypothetical protein